MIDGGSEAQLRRLEGIIVREIDVKKEQTVLVWSARWSCDGRLPSEVVVVLRLDGAALVLEWSVDSQLLVFLHDSLQSCHDDASEDDRIVCKSSQV